MSASIIKVQPQTDAYAALLAAADELHQANYIVVRPDYIDEASVFGVFQAERCVGFLRCYIQVIGREEGRSPIYDTAGRALREGFVEAFGVLHAYRRQGLGQQLQEYAIAYCIKQRCYQIRSRSPITSSENYALKLKMGYTIHPSRENDSYFFAKILTPGHK